MFSIKLAERRNAMAFLTSLTDWLVRTDFYIGFCSNLPQPLNNPYFDVLVIVIALIMIILGVRDGAMSYVFRMRIRKKNSGSAKVSMAMDMEESGNIPIIKDFEKEDAVDISAIEESENSETVESPLIKGFEEVDPAEVLQSTVIDEPDMGSSNEKSDIDVRALIESIPDGDLRQQPEMDRTVSEFDLLMMNLKNQRESKAKNEEIKEKTAQIRERNLAALDKKISSNIKKGGETAADKHDSAEDIQADVEARREEYRKEEERKARKGLFSGKNKKP